jgi:aryl-alcohol dehydrogenase-like predicted oxidoreductase
MCRYRPSDSEDLVSGTPPDESIAVKMVRDAVDAGIRFFDNCCEYHRGKKGLKGVAIAFS